MEDEDGEEDDGSDDEEEPGRVGMEVGLGRTRRKEVGKEKAGWRTSR